MSGMTVKELIQELRKYDDSDMVNIEVDDNFDWS